MGGYLNPSNDKFVSYRDYPFYVDKTLLIEETNCRLGFEKTKYMCVTRPRRFGKTLALSTLCAYYSKGCDSTEPFKDLKISKDPSFAEHLNKHNVILIDAAGAYTGAEDKENFVCELEHNVLLDLKEAFPGVLAKAI